MKIHGMKKEWRSIVRDAQKRGWTVEVMRSCHVRWTWTDGRVLFTPLTSDSTPRMRQHELSMKKVERGEPVGRQQIELSQRAK